MNILHGGLSAYEELIILKQVWKKFKSTKVVPYVFTLPFLVTFLIFFLFPIIRTILMSFQEIIPGSTEWIGLENYRDLFDDTFLKALYNTFIFTFFSVVILILLPMFLAVLLNFSITRFRNPLKMFLFLPAVVSTIVGGVIFRQIFGELDTSFMNHILSFFSIPPQQWTMHASTGMFLMVLLAVWRWTGVNILYFLAGLQNISGELYESADMDGANWFHKFFYIILPSLKPVVLFVMVISVSAGLKMFEESYVFWQGTSPKNIGLTIVGYIYKEGIALVKMGLGSAAGVILLILIMLASIIQFKRFGLFEEE